MRRTARDNRPHVKPVERIELREKHFKLRIVLFAAFLLIGVSLLIYGLSGLFTEESGWRIIEVSSTGTADCSSDFTLQYDVGQGEMSARREVNALSELYGEAAAEAYRIFHETEQFAGVHNIAYLNENPNTSVKVDGVLYDALSKLDAAESRQLYMAPVFEYYRSLFLCAEDVEADSYDPTVNEELDELFSELLVYINDPNHISVELMEDETVCLRMSEEYLRFAGENDVYSFVSFHWMKNAFIADYLAETLIEGGFTHGSLSSVDGFCRNLDSRGISYSFNLFNKIGKIVHSPGTMNYAGPLSIVSLRSFPVNSDDNERYYVRENGEVRFPYIDMEDGHCRAALSNLVCYSADMDCADILLRVIPFYVTDNPPDDAIKAAAGFDSIFCRGGTILHTAETVNITNVSDEDGYRIRHFG